jgi:hypothetical protein
MSGWSREERTNHDCQTYVMRAGAPTQGPKKSNKAPPWPWSSRTGTLRTAMDFRRRPRKRLQHRPVVTTSLIFAVAYLLVFDVLVHRSPPNNDEPAKRTSSRSSSSLADRSGEVVPSAQQQMSLAEVEQLSSVDYMACCGAGHRTSKLAEAGYLAKLLGFSLRVYWGYCNTYETRQQQTEVFQYVHNTFESWPFALYTRHLTLTVPTQLPIWRPASGSRISQGTKQYSTKSLCSHQQ